MIATLLDEQDASETREDSRDEVLCQGAKGRLCSTGYRSLRRLGCTVAAGVVTISGCVPSYFLKQMAQEAVMRLDHVRKVRNLVIVRFEMEEESPWL